MNDPLVVVTEEMVEEWVKYVRSALTSKPGIKATMSMNRSCKPIDRDVANAYVLGKDITIIIRIEEP